MDPDRLDYLARTLATAGSRRRLLGVLAATPLLGGLLGLLEDEDVEAKERRRRRKQRHKSRKKPGNRKKGCKPKSRATVCAGYCGSVKNRETCGKTVDCGSCECSPACTECFTCQGAPGACMPQDAGTPCGAAATCDSGTLFPRGSCDGAGNCLSALEVSCDPYTQCDGDACATTCAIDDDCVTGSNCNAGQCVGDLPDGQTCATNGQCASGFCVEGVCCESACEAACFACNVVGSLGMCAVDPAQQGETCGSDGKVCQPDGTCACVPLTECPAGKDCGTYPDGCGGFVDCPVVCANPTPACEVNICVPCESSDQCASGELCNTGLCEACDVCQLPAVCAFTSVQAAINAPAQLATIFVCPGTYVENASQFAGVHVTRSLQLIGAGDGADDSTNTILKPAQTNKMVVLVQEASGVLLENLRLTGASGPNGDGVVAFLSQCELRACTITGNSSGTSGGFVGVGSQIILTNTRVAGNTGKAAGGIDMQGAGTITLDETSRVTGNIAPGSYGGMRVISGSTAELKSADNVTGNTNGAGLKNCGGGGTFTGPGAICTTT